MPEIADSLHVRVGPQGRVVIPASLRKALELKQGEELIARLSGQQLILERPEVVEQRLSDRFKHIPKTISLAAELIKERRQEAKRQG